MLDRNYADVAKGESVRIGIKAALGVKVRARVYNLTGELIKTFELTTTIDGWNSIDWDCTNSAGKKVGRGMYFVRIAKENSAEEVRRVYIIK